MDALKVFIRNHPVVTYFALTFAISWGGVLVVIGGSGGMAGTAPTGDPRFVYAVPQCLRAGPQHLQHSLDRHPRRMERHSRASVLRPQMAPG
jgi:hypothetical protein